MLKKVFLFVIGVVLMLNVSLAEVTYELGFYSISNKEIIFQNRDSVTISFDITNTTGNYYSKLFCVPTLEVRGGNGSETLYFPYQIYESKAFSLKPYEAKTLVYECKLPKTLPSKKLMITVNLYSEFYSEPFESLSFYLKQVGEDFDGFLESEDEIYWKKSDGEFISADKEISVSKSDLPKMYLKLKSCFEIEKKVFSNYALYERNNAVNNPVYIGRGNGIIFKAGETKEIEIELPTFYNDEKYLIKLNFIDGLGNKVSNLYEYRYVVNEESAKITKIVFNKENSEIKTYLYGTKELKGVEVDINVYGKNKNLISTKKSTVELKTEDMYVDMPLQNVSEDIVDVAVKVNYKGKELAKKTEQLNLTIENATDKFSDIKNLECERAVKVLNGLGIINGYPDNTYKPENNVTRAEFSTIVTKLRNLELLNEDTGKFSDISNHWAKNYINTLNVNGFVSGYPDGTFGPQNNVTYSEAITILLNALGYKGEVNKSEEGWPYNYIMKAIGLGLIDGVNIEKFSSPANRGDIATLTLNAYSLK